MDKQDFLSAWASIPRGFHDHENENGTGSFTLPAFDAQSGVYHAFSSRTGGISEGERRYLNLSMTRERYEPHDVTVQNYERFCQAEGIDPDSMVMDNYQHRTTVLPVTKVDCGRGWTREPLPFCDGLVTDDPAVTLVTGHADCMAFYFFDPVRRCIGLAHAGWRGALGRIGAQAVHMLCEQYGSDPKNILAGVGPSICQRHFEVDEGLGEQFAKAFPLTACKTDGATGKAHVDLWQVAVSQLLEARISAAHISLSGVCTYEDERLYSYRRDKLKTGGMAAFLRLC